MKSNWLIILLIIVAGNTINLGTSLKFGNPSIEFAKNSGHPGNNDDVYIYSIKLRSNEELLKFEVKPSIKGVNVDSEMKYFFDDNTHQAMLNYFYVIPKGIDSDEIVLTFKLTDKKESNVRREIIKLDRHINLAKANSKGTKIKI